MTLARRWSELSPAEARELFDRYVDGHSGRVADLREAVRHGGGPVDRLDFGRESLGPLWAWVMATHPPPSRAVSDDEMQAAEPPWWYDFHRPLGQRIGPALARLVSPIAAYLAETIIRTRPGSTWVLGTDRRAADYNQPLLRVEGGGEFSPDGVILVAANQWANGILASPNRLLEFYDVRAGPGPSTLPAGGAPADAGTPYSVERDPDGAFDTVISFDEAVAHDDEDRIERLVQSISREPGVEKAIWEDREVVLVRAPTLDDDAIEAALARIWRGDG